MKDNKSFYFCAGIIIFFVFLIEFLAYSTAMAQLPGVWESFGPSLKAPQITILLADPANPELIYAGTKENGVFRSTDFGLSWRQANIPMTDKWVSAMVSVGEKLYASTIDDGVFYSIDKGVNWTQANKPLHDKAVIAMINVGDTLYVGTGYSNGDEHGVFYSTDDGVNWTQANEPMNDKYVLTLLSVDGVLYAGTIENGIYYSTDHGVNWTQANPPIHDKTVTILISVGGTLYAGTRYNGVFYSTDAGVNWTQAKAPMSNKEVMTLIAVDTTLYAAGNYKGIFYSTDGGINWVQTNTPVNNKEVSALISVDKRIYAGTFEDHNPSGLFYSDDGGKNWTHANAPMDSTQVTSLIWVNGRLYAGTSVDAVFRSTDGGVNWFGSDQSFFNSASLLDLAVNPNFIVTSGYDGVFRSVDGGRNWIQANPPLNEQRVSSLILFNGTLYAGTEPTTSYPLANARISRSTDGGISWIVSPVKGTYVTSLYAIGGTIYAGLHRSFTPREYFPLGIIYSRDGGINWISAKAPMHDKRVMTITSVNERIYVGTRNYGLFFSSDSGINWTQANTPINNVTVTTLMSLNGTLYAGTERDGIFWSIDGGNNWTQANAPMNNMHVTSMNSIDGTLCVGTGFPINQVQIDNKMYGIFYSKDGGINWTQANVPTEDEVITIKLIGQALYAGMGQNGVFRSTDGENWVPLHSGMYKRKVSALVYLSILNRLYAATDNGVYFQTLDITSPTAVSININGGVTFTKQRDVQLTLLANAADSMSLTQDQNFSNSVWKVYQVNSPFTLIPGDGPKTIYVRFADISYNISDTLQASITLDETLPTTPGSLSSQLVPGQPNKRSLTWTKSTDATSGIDRYRIHLSQNRNFSGVTTTRDSIFASENPSYTTPILADAKWYWRVSAIDRAGNESVSLADSFVVNVGQAPAAPSIQLAASITNDNTPTISWSQVEGAETYRLQYAASDSFANATTISDLTVPNYTFTQALPDGLFFFRVYAKNASSIESVASPTAQLSIDTRVPQNPVLEIAAGTAYIKTANVSLRLSATGADSVRLLGDLANNNLAWFQLFDIGNPIHTQVNVNLQPGDGVKNLHAQFKDRAGNIATIFRSIFLDTQMPVFPSGSPQLSVATPSLNQAVAVSLAAPTDGNGSGIKSFLLYYRRSGERWENQNNVAFQNNLVQIPAALVTIRGVDYQIVAEDSAGNKQALRNDNLDFFSIPVSIRADEVGSSPGLPGGTSGSAYRLISLPLMVENKPVSEIFTDLGNYGIDKDYFFWRYEGGNTWRDGANIPVQPGESYFLIRRKSGSLSNKSAGTTAKATDAALGNIIGWQLRANDWTLIGNPFNFEISLIDLRSQNRDTSLVFIPDVWSYDGGSINKGWTKQNLRLSPWSGLAIYNTGTTDTLIFIPSTSPASIATTPLTRYFDASFSQDEWKVQIRAESRGFQDNENYIGVRKEAQTNQDEFDLYEPPLVPGGVSLNFTANNSEPRRSLAADIRPLNETGYEWTLQLKGVGGSEVKLNFEELATFPTETKIYLLDRSSRLLRDLRKQPEIVVYLPQSTATKTMTILVGEKAFVEKHSEGLQAVPTTFALHQNYPNPFNPTTVIRYELPVAGKVTLKLYNLLGTEVATLENDEPRDAGFYERMVDLRQFAAGIYFYRIEVRGEKRFEATKKMVFTK